MRLREQAASGGASSGCMGLLDLGREEAVSGGSSCCARLLTCAGEKPVSGKAPAARRCMLLDARLLVARFISNLPFLGLHCRRISGACCRQSADVKATPTGDSGCAMISSQVIEAPNGRIIKLQHGPAGGQSPAFL